MWLDDDSQGMNGVSIRVLAGPAGIGKTRMAFELCLEANVNDWTAGFLHHGARLEDVWTIQGPTLCIVDYAGSRAGEIARFIGSSVARGPQSPDGRLRVLLLERSGKSDLGWWNQAFNGVGVATASSLLGVHQVQRPSPLGNAHDRFALVNHVRSLKQLPELLDGEWKDVERALVDRRDESPGRDPWEEVPLFLMLATLSEASNHETLPLSSSRIELSLSIARREFARIELIAEGEPIDAATVRRALVIRTICSTASIKDWARLLKVGLGALAPDASGLSTLNRVIQKISPPTTGPVPEPLHPDIIGEAFVLVECMNSFGLDVAIRMVLRLAKYVGIFPIVDFLVRAAQDFSHMGDVSDIDSDDFPSLGSIPLVLLKRLFVSSSHGHRKAILDAIPSETMCMRELAASLSRIVNDRQVKGSSSNIDRIEALTDHARRLLSAGDTSGAQKIVTEVFALASDDGNVRTTMRLGFCLTDLSITCFDLGNVTLAMRAIDAAIRLRRFLANRISGSFKDSVSTQLGFSLVMKGIIERQLTLYEEAAASFEEAQATLGSVANTDDAWNNAFQLLMSNECVVLWELGKHNLATSTSLDAVRYFRTRATYDPDEFTRMLVLSLINAALFVASPVGQNDLFSGLGLLAEGENLLRRQAQGRPSSLYMLKDMFPRILLRRAVIFAAHGQLSLALDELTASAQQLVLHFHDAGPFSTDVADGILDQWYLQHSGDGTVVPPEPIAELELLKDKFRLK
ncbi:hypothetical protein AYO38_02600 [bacterium SCGC AG-212-C10]|nr:hypothetical protein AYO38_02600 [bacterium SCGC AG-212-C10]